MKQGGEWKVNFFWFFFFYFYQSFDFVSTQFGLDPEIVSGIQHDGTKHERCQRFRNLWWWLVGCMLLVFCGCCGCGVGCLGLLTGFEKGGCAGDDVPDDVADYVVRGHFFFLFISFLCGRVFWWQVETVDTPRRKILI